MQETEAPWRPWLQDSKCPQVSFHNQEEPGSHGIPEPDQLSTACRKQVSRHMPLGSGVGSFPVGGRGGERQGPTPAPALGAVSPGHCRSADTPPRAREGGARKPWRAARTRAIERGGEGRGTDEEG